MELGKKATLYIVKKTPMALFLGEDIEALGDSIQLPKEEAQQLLENESLAVGDALEVYCYLNMDGQVAATLKAPILANGEIGILECVGSNRFGAFLNWGYEKDILLPFGEQLSEVKKGHKVLVGLYTDKSGRLCATQKLKKFLTIDEVPPYKVGDVVNGIVYDLSEEIGAFVAVEHRYFGLIFAEEVMPSMKVGDEVTARITKIREDYKINLSTSKRVDLQMDEDSAKIWSELEENGGFLPYHDKTDSEVIRRVFDMSKKAFKRSVGQLYREKRIRIEEDGIHRVDEQ